jgi:hypothetical protein
VVILGGLSWEEFFLERTNEVGIHECIKHMAAPHPLQVQPKEENSAGKLI